MNKTVLVCTSSLLAYIATVFLQWLAPLTCNQWTLGLSLNPVIGSDCSLVPETLLSFLSTGFVPGMDLSMLSMFYIV